MRPTLKQSIELLEKTLDTSKFGIGEAKKWEDLIEEIKKGECEIRQENEGLPVRIVRVVFIQVWRHNQRLHQNQILVEDRQEFADGRIRKRDLKGIAEKAKFGKDPFAEAVRGLEEELGIKVLRSLLKPIFLGSNNTNVEIETKDSPSYPGLKTQYEKHHFQYQLPIEHWKEEFVESQPDKTTYFVWQ